MAYDDKYFDWQDIEKHLKGAIDPVNNIPEVDRDLVRRAQRCSNRYPGDLDEFYDLAKTEEAKNYIAMLQGLWYDMLYDDL